MADRYDVVVLGGGQNGLAAACRLAGAGRSVLVLEKRDELGGLCAPIEFHPGYRVPGLLHDEGRLEPAVTKRLRLEDHGLELREAPPVLLAESDGPGILLSRDGDATGDEIAARSGPDADAWRAYRAFFDAVRPLVRRLWTSPPPPLSPGSVPELWEVARQGFGAWRLGRRTTLELLRVAPMCVADFLNERFGTPLLVEGLAAAPLLGTWSGPWSAGTTTNLLLLEAAPGRHVAGGPAALIGALERATRAAGATIRTGAEVARIRISGGRPAGVTLRDGEEIDTEVVVSSLDPRRTFLDLVPPATLPVGLEHEIRNIRMRGTAAKIHVALAGTPEVASRPGQEIEALHVGGGHVDRLERAFDAVKYRRASSFPVLDVRIPSVSDPDLAPPGHHVLSVQVGYAPYDLDGGWSELARAELQESVLGTLEAHVPGVRDRLVACQVVSPPDLEAGYGVTGGQLHHGEPALDQLFVLRPSAATARYATPVPGLYLGGSGSHGGGGVTCTAGLLAADAVLAG